MSAIGYTHLVSLSACEAWLFQPPDNRALEVTLAWDSPENAVNLSMEDIAELWRATQAHQRAAPTEAPSPRPENPR